MHQAGEPSRSAHQSTSGTRRGTGPEDGVTPDGHQVPLIDRCTPTRCANSTIALAHLPIWTAACASIKDLLEY
ncbi:hypothetical protein GCM10023335_60890 [Streptomyces siamensis]|uniref:Uncharacterized protein n=1 Tax=Streptomyces siamensis TaxID=1274986 RepID=A0ABP9JAF2_9ACTN